LQADPDRNPRPRLANPIHFLAFGFGSGCAPTAPGTFGTLVGVAAYALLGLLPVPAYLAAVAALAVAGVAICGSAARDLAVHDHPGIVWDEIAGFLVTMIALPYEARWMILGFVLFRLFDILKPWPIGWVDRRVSGGLGIMLDDLLAGFLACCCLHGIRYLGGLSS
jgi:phosphatidylglycerophosphatase A